MSTSSTRIMKRAKGLVARLTGDQTEPSGEKWLKESMRAAERSSGYVAIYIVAPVLQRWPIAFGICSDPVTTYYSYQKGWWEEHGLHTVLWTPGKPAAERIKRKMAQRLAKKKRFFSASWYDVTAEEAHATLLQVAAEEGVPLFDEVERQRRFAAAAQLEREALEGVLRPVPTLALPQSSVATVIPLRPKTPIRRGPDGQKSPHRRV